jgi:D-3-phosphoglycerate dehydrogenase
MPPFIVILDSVFSSYQEELEVLAELNSQVEIDNPKTKVEIIKKVKKADAVLVNLHALNEDIITQMQCCRVISRYGVGVDNVDIEAATRKKIWVANVPDYCIEETADHALALLLSCIHSIVIKDCLIRQGHWKLENGYPLSRISTCTLGIIGYGRIGKAFHKKVSNLGLARVLICDPYVVREKMREFGGEKVELDELLKKSDFVSLHLPLTKETFHLLGKNEFKIMKPGAIIINTSRGAVIDEQALAFFLKSKRLGSAGLDVFEEEPLPRHSPLLKLENVVLSDHTAYYSRESIKELKTKTARNVVWVFKQGKPLFPVNNF